MNQTNRFLFALSLAAAMLSPLAALAEPSAVYLVRHGEKETTGKDPELTAQGKERARNIATILQKAGIRNVFSSPYARTKQTADPLAKGSGVEVQIYDAGKPALLVEKVKALNGPVLVVGHSNTLPELVRLFGGAPGTDIADNEYDRVYQLTRGADGAIATVLLTSIPATGPAQ
jgi:broad specificity phosphatase PhoE